MPRPDGPHAGGTGDGLRLVRRGSLLEVRLVRPEVRNALDEALIAAATRAFQETASARGAEAPRAVLLSAEGRCFCAGADLQYMRRVAGFSREENEADGRRLSELFRAVRACPVLVIARVQGDALGGGCGLLAACDLVVSSETARFGFPEVRLGVVPATISPFVIERIGPVRARALFSGGEIVEAVEAQRIGLVDRVVPPDRLDEAIDRVCAAVLAAAPLASREAKRLADEVGRRLGGGDPPALPRAGSDEPISRSLDPTLGEETARRIAALRAAPEAAEGIRAFLEKRPARWVESWPPPTGGRAAAGTDAPPREPA